MKKSNITRTPLGKKPVLRLGRLETVPVYPNGKFVFTGQSSPVVNPRPARSSPAWPGWIAATSPKRLKLPTRLLSVSD
jgi:hypothetical protein